MIGSRTISGTIESLERIRNSANGNPRYRVYLRHGSVLTTAADAAVNYEIDSAFTIGVDLDIVLNGHGKIIGISKVKGES